MVVLLRQKALGLRLRLLLIADIINDQINDIARNLLFDPLNPSSHEMPLNMTDVPWDVAIDYLCSVTEL